MADTKATAGRLLIFTVSPDNLSASLLETRQPSRRAVCHSAGVSSWLLLEIFHPDSMWRRNFVDEPDVLVESLICHKRRTFGVEKFYTLA